MPSSNSSKLDRAVSGTMAVALAGYLGALFWNLATILNQFSWNSDADSAKNLATSILAGAPGAHIFTQQAGFIWLDVLTGWLPIHVQIWVVLPWMFWLVTATTLTLCSRKLGGRNAALMTLLLSVALSPTLLPGFLINTFHGYAWATIAVFGYSALAFAGSRWRWREVAALGILGGISFATDPLGALCAAVPLSAVALLLLWNRQKLAATLCGSVVAISAIVFGAVQLLMHASRYSGGLPGAGQQGIPSLSAMGDHVRLLWNGLLDMANGQSMTLHPLPVPAFALALVVALAVAILPLWAALAGLRKRRTDPTTIYFVYWAVGALLLALALVGTNTALPTTVYDPANEIVFAPTRYLTPIWLAFAAVVPVWLASHRKRFALASTGSFLFVATSTAALLVAVTAGDFRPRPADDLPQLSAYLSAHHLQRGYTSYWDAQAINWNSGGGVPLYSIAEGIDCGQPGDVLCYFAYNATSSWFSKTSLPTAVVVDPAVTWAQNPPPAYFGAPSAVDQVGRFTVYWYPYDVSSNFITKCAGRTDHSCG